ncbi:MAG TPA: secondary thiamine-phosphate synthase enzyme YjbQ [Geomobilimonas sp.]|nr:secondary thiamine-phosphate synthase enzyme YjbQ [Geomobilimonas sp.]
MIRHITLKSHARTEFIDITGDVRDLVKQTGIKSGVLHLFILHTTAAITVNEGADPAVQRDISRFLCKLVPNDPYFTHSEGNSDAHIKSSLVGTSQTLLVDGGKLVLGTWQAVYFCEFDGPRERKVAVRIAADD